MVYCVPGFGQGAKDNWQYDSNFGSNYVPAIYSDTVKIDWAGNWELYLYRPGWVQELAEPYMHHYDNMDYAIQAQVYVSGITDALQVEQTLVQAWVESDLFNCNPGGETETVPIKVSDVHAGEYGHNTVFRWNFESWIMYCPEGTYKYRFYFSADGGKSFTILGNADSTDNPNHQGFRTIIKQ